MKKNIMILIGTLIYILLLVWTIDFMVLTLLDLKIVLSITFGTLLFYVLLAPKKISKIQTLNYIKWYSQLSAILLTLLLEMQVIANPIDINTLSDIIIHLRPLFYSSMIYIVVEFVTKSLSNKPINMDSSLTKDFTKRELEVYHLILENLSNHDIANKLYISESTVKKHVQNILQKTGTANREELKYKAKN